MIAITLALELLLMTLLGVFIQKMKFVGPNFADELTSMIMKVLFPMLVFYSIKSAPSFTAETLTTCLLVMVIGTAVMFISLGIGQIFYLRSGKDGMGRILRYAVTFTHFTFMGMPVIDVLFGSMGTLYYVFFMVPVRIFYYALPQPLMTPPELKTKRSLGATIKGVALNPSLIAVALGLVFWITGWQLPTVIDYVVKQCYSICSPLGLILCGLILGKYDFKRLISVRYIKAPILRLIVMPAIFLGLTRLLLLTSIDPIIPNMIVIYAALPTASLLPAYALQYDPDPENQFTAAGTCVISTLFSTVTIPLWHLLLQAL